MKKFFTLSLGCLFVILAIIFFVVPGPSIIFGLAALMCFSFYYPKARIYLKKLQRIFRNVCYRLDKVK
ncbi:PGPGW domain-containing protein [Pseudoalteromonas sp. BZB3]|uniref:Tellurium resistance protein TerC n=1 Tax=Pseudoalteromonas phenolica TaxID=161398 RepID=A0A5R9Q4V3_9GAMM|nr:PGPGW domain-containing protein [Pseudoalteromonas phenolica]TLX48188.1 hypothetical protein C1E24_05155 [Pseudoalteromonas phenolica]